jgi:hypothetical protein
MQPTGTCLTAKCSNATCSSAYMQPPTAFPPPSGTVPSKPLFECPVAYSGYNITSVPRSLPSLMKMIYRGADSAWPEPSHLGHHHHPSPDNLSIRIRMLTSALMSEGPCLQMEHLSRCKFLSIYAVASVGGMILCTSNDCNCTKAQKWLINLANTKVREARTNFCLDAGTSTFSLLLSSCYCK